MADIKEAERAPPDQDAQGIKRTAEDVCDEAPQSEPKRAAAAAEDDSTGNIEQGEYIEIKVQFGKHTQIVKRNLDSTVGDLKEEIEKQTGK